MRFWEKDIYLTAIMRLRREISAVLLLAVFLPTLMVVFFHRHDAAIGVHEDGGVCAGCEENVPHSHLNGVPHTDECFLCQFLTAVWLTSVEQGSEIPAEEYSDSVVASAEQPLSPTVSILSARAPPAVFC